VLDDFDERCEAFRRSRGAVTKVYGGIVRSKRSLLQQPMV
jgi:hypothetical protein